MRMKFVTAAAALVALSCCLHAAPAQAEAFTFTATGPTLSLTAILTGVADPTVAGAFDLTGGVGVANGNVITLYTPSGTAATYEDASFGPPEFTYESSYEYDNVLFTQSNGPTGLLLDQYGLLFSEATDHINVFGQGAYSFTNDETLYGFSGDGLSSVKITPLTGVTPEPSSIALLGTGLLGAVGVLRRRYRA